MKTLTEDQLDAIRAYNRERVAMEADLAAERITLDEFSERGRLADAALEEKVPADDVPDELLGSYGVE